MPRPEAPATTRPAEEFEALAEGAEADRLEDPDSEAEGEAPELALPVALTTPDVPLAGSETLPLLVPEQSTQHPWPCQLVAE